MIIAEVTWIDGAISIFLGFLLFTVLMLIITHFHKPRMSDWEREQRETAKVWSDYLQ